MAPVQILNSIGLVAQVIGALVSASGVLLTDAMAGRLAATQWDENTALRAALRKQSKRAGAGLIILASGAGLQLAAQFL